VSLNSIKRGMRTDSLTADNLTSKVVIRPGGRSSVSGVVATVFGSTGFVGRYAVNRLGRVGCQVVIPYRGDGINTRHLKLMGDYGQIVPIPFDLYDEESIRRAVSRSNVVVNLLGAQYETRNFSFHDIHVKATYRIAKIAQEAGVKRFIQMSTVGADRNSNSEWIRTKAMSEEIVRNFFPDTSTILRCCTIYGQEDQFLTRLAALANTVPVMPLINKGKQRLQPLYVQDVANAILCAISSPESMGKIYELGGPKVLTLEQVVNLVLDQIVQKSNALNISYKWAHFYGYLFEWLPVAWRLLSRDHVNQMSNDLIVSENALKLSDLGLIPHPYESSIPEVLLAFRAGRKPQDYPDRSPLSDA